MRAFFEIEVATFLVQAVTKKGGKGMLQSKRIEEIKVMQISRIGERATDHWKNLVLPLLCMRVANGELRSVRSAWATQKDGEREKLGKRLSNVRFKTNLRIG